MNNAVHRVILAGISPERVHYCGLARAAIERFRAACDRLWRVVPSGDDQHRIFVKCCSETQIARAESLPHCGAVAAEAHLLRRH